MASMGEFEEETTADKNRKGRLTKTPSMQPT